MTTMLLGGLWHGASWMYLIWGGLQGVFLVGHKELHNHTRRRQRRWWRVAFNVFITFNLIAISFMFFRARSMEAVGDMTRQIIHDFHPEIAPQFVTGYLMVVLALVGGYLMHFAPESLTRRLRGAYAAMPLIIQALILALIIFLIIQVRSSEIVPFLYLQY